LRIKKLLAISLLTFNLVSASSLVSCLAKGFPTLKKSNKIYTSVYARVADKALPSVVQITYPFEKKVVDGKFKGQMKTMTVVGAGIFVNPKGYILTSAHIFNKLEDRFVTVTFYSSSLNFITGGLGQILVIDKDIDLAIVKMGYQDSSYPVLKFVDVNTLQVGREVIVIGQNIFDFRNFIFCNLVIIFKKFL